MAAVEAHCCRCKEPRSLCVVLRIMTQQRKAGESGEMFRVVVFPADVNVGAFKKKSYGGEVEGLHGSIVCVILV